MEKLFSYGTLQFEHVQIATFGRKLVGKKDSLIGYALSEVKITDKAVIETSGTETHPILKFTGNPSDLVEGSVFEITLDELHQADKYEVDEYVRIKGSFTSGEKAWAYVCSVTEQSKALL